MYTVTNYKTKKALRDDVAKGVKVRVYQPNQLPGVPTQTDGEVTLEGPHYPKPHTWYATATIANGYIVPGSVR